MLNIILSLVFIIILIICIILDVEFYIDNSINIIIMVISLIGTIIFTSLSIVTIIMSIGGTKEYEYTKEMVQEVYKNSTDNEKIAIDNKIIEVNQWIVKVKTNKENYGLFSVYYFVDIDELEYITIKE